MKAHVGAETMPVLIDASRKKLLTASLRAKDILLRRHFEVTLCVMPSVILIPITNTSSNL